MGLRRRRDGFEEETDGFEGEDGFEEEERWV